MKRAAEDAKVCIGFIGAHGVRVCASSFAHRNLHHTRLWIALPRTAAAQARSSLTILQVSPADTESNGAQAAQWLELAQSKVRKKESAPEHRL